jgi:hypothetical protein
MGALRVLRTSTLCGLAVSYLIHQYWNPAGVAAGKCTQFSKGLGMDANGNPFKTFDEFYPYYLCEHEQPRTKLFHFLATFNELALLSHMFLLSKEGFKITTLVLILLQGYGLAWYSHFTIEQNKPATWQYPVWSYLADHQLFAQTLLGHHLLWS